MNINFERTARAAMAAIIATALTFAFNACSEEETEEKGNRVYFGATTTYDNFPETKTIYSGEEYIVSGKAYERINWTGTDKVDVLNSKNAQSAVFSVTTPTGDNNKSGADLVYDAGDVMYWEAGENTFLSVYPSGAYRAGIISGTLPKVQDQTESHESTIGLTTSNASETVTTPSMRLAYMVAKETLPITEKIKLRFRPAMTAFEFNVAFADDGTTAPTISKFQMWSTSTALTGTWKWDGKRFDCPDFQKGVNDTITVNFKDVPIDTANPLRFTVFALPHDITDVKVRFFLNTGPKTLSLKDNSDTFTTFEACKKYRVSTPNVSGDWTYKFSTTDPSPVAFDGSSDDSYIQGTVTSFKYRGKPASHDYVEEPVKWIVEGYYADAECTKKLPGKPYWAPYLFGGDEKEDQGTGSVEREKVTIKYAHSHASDSLEVITTEANDLNSLVGSRSMIGSSSSYHNLSNPTNPNSDYIAESANSYIVNACGYYRIPLVMGNGVKNNALNNEKVYKGAQGNGTDDFRILFKNYKGNNIQSPYLQDNGGTPTSAEIVWEDVEGLIETTLDKNGANTYDLPSNCVYQSGGVYWLRFHVPTERRGQWIYRDDNGKLRNEPRQGNAVIAVKDASGDVMWSYHIWVTDYVPKNYPNYSASVNKDIDFALPYYFESIDEVDGGSGMNVHHFINSLHLGYRIMNRVLGYTVYGTEVTRNYPAKKVYVKLRQNDGVSRLTTVMAISQNEGRLVNSLNRSQPFFQALRKDAFWPGAGKSDLDPVWYGKKPRLNTTRTTEGKPIDYLISNPGVWVNRTDGTGNCVNLPYYENIWNADLRKSEGSEIVTYPSESNFAPTLLRPYSLFKGGKTIYDPCPAGYSLPPHLSLSLLFTSMSPASELAKNFVIGWYDRSYNPAHFPTQVRRSVDEGLIFYTNLSQTKEMFIPYTSTRDAKGSLSRYDIPLGLFHTNMVSYNPDTANRGHRKPIAYYDSSKESAGESFIMSQGAAVLPFDESVYPTIEDFYDNQVLYSYSLTAILGRYTLTYQDPQLQ